ncbi:hypothetical protein HETIRDRAFT_240452, partial [Heterobasidion irregulare TC 32-1]
VTAAPASHSSFDWNAVKYVYAFGDSYSFVQGTTGFPNFSFIGDAFHPAFTSEQLLSNEIVPKNTSSDGSNWLELLTGCGQGHPSKCKQQLWDFAFAGADIDKDLHVWLPLHHNFTVDLVDQVNQWAQYASDVIPHKPNKSTMTFWWIGINDTNDVAGQNACNFNAFWNSEMDSYFRAVELAYTVGLRGTHLFVNVPPGERTPASLPNPTKAAIQKQRIAEYNAALDARVDQFAAAHPTSTVLKFDANAWFNKVLNNYKMFGFSNITSYCTCKDPTFFWYNTGHPTEHVHRLLAQTLEIDL